MSKELYENGLKVRRAVLGDAYVDRAMKNADSFNKPLQDLVSEYCWGWIWTRDGNPAANRPHPNYLGLSEAMVDRVLVETDK